MAQPAPEGGNHVVGAPRRVSSESTMLKALLRERHLHNYGMFKRAYQKAAKGVDKDLIETYPSRATLYRWLAGQVEDLPYPHHCAVLEAMLPGWTAAQLFQPLLSAGGCRGVDPVAGVATAALLAQLPGVLPSLRHHRRHD